MTCTTAALIAERAKTHGDYSVQTIIAQKIKRAMCDTDSFHCLSPQHKEALDMIAHKIGRVLAGDPNHRDHWDDIAGYAQLAADRCKPG
jgi:hypothetical protein